MRPSEDLKSPLKQPATAYPDAYLCARLVPRLARLFERSEVSSWHKRRENVLWSFHQLSPGLRRKLEPLYLYIELPILMTAIRYTISNQSHIASEFITKSLWNQNIEKRITQPQEKYDLTLHLTKILAPYDWHLPLATHHGQAHQSLQIESQLYLGLFEKVNREKPCKVIKDTIAAVVDLFNLSQQHNGQSDPPSLWIPGGKLEANDFITYDRLRRAINRCYGYPVNELEDSRSQLYTNYFFTLKQRQRTGITVTRVIAYLWGQLPEAPWQQPRDVATERAS